MKYRVPCISSPITFPCHTLLPHITHSSLLQFIPLIIKFLTSSYNFSGEASPASLIVILVAPTDWHQYFIRPDTPISGFDSIHVIYSETLNSRHPGRVLNCCDRIGLGNNCGAVWTDRLHSSMSDFRIKITFALSPGLLVEYLNPIDSRMKISRGSNTLVFVEGSLPRPIF